MLLDVLAEEDLGKSGQASIGAAKAPQRAGHGAAGNQVLQHEGMPATQARQLAAGCRGFQCMGTNRLILRHRSLTRAVLQPKQPQISQLCIANLLIRIV